MYVKTWAFHNNLCLTYHGPQARPYIKNSAFRQRTPHPIDTEDSINTYLQSSEIEMVYLHYIKMT